MPLLIPILQALAAGGTLVPHAAGGFIVSTAGSYVAGTYISSAVVSSILAAAASTLGIGATLLSGVVGSAGIFGTSIGATGITGALMSAGLISSTPIAVPILAGGGAIGLAYASYHLYTMQEKIKNGEEVHFTELEAKIVENVIKRIGAASDIESEHNDKSNDELQNNLEVFPTNKS